MYFFLPLIAIIVASFILGKSADLIVHVTVSLARRFHVSEFSMGFFILGLATTTPEIFVGLNAVIDGHPELSLGNLIGASIVLITLIVGLSAAITGEIRFVDNFRPRDMWLTSFTIVLPTFFLLDGTLSRFDGLVLLAFYGVVYLVMNREQTFVEHVKESLSGTTNHLARKFSLLVVGVIGLFVASRVVVMAAETIAVSLHLPYVLVGLLLLSIGTNLP